MTFLKNILTSDSDNDLIKAYKDTGQLNYLSLLYQRYMDLVFGICLKYFIDTEKSKDAVMDIFEELILKLKHHEVENFKGWLYTLSRNFCLMKIRKDKKINIVDFDNHIMQSTQIQHLDDEVFEKEACFKKLEQCLKKLPNEQEQSVKLFYLDNKCYNEIAIITGYDWNKVRSYIQNARRNLKTCMDMIEVKN